MARQRSSLGPAYRRLWSASVVSNLGDGIGYVAYPWLASALTRNPVLIAGLVVATRLPWLVVTLPAGVITDRVDRRRLVVGMDIARFVLTAIVGLAVLGAESALSDPVDIAAGRIDPPSNGTFGLIALYLAALLLGCAEVLRDNAAQTLLPAIVPTAQLEKANGRMWGAEMVMNGFVGPPLAGFLLAASFAVPFLIDAGTFAVSAALVSTVSGSFRATPDPADDASTETPGFREQLNEGFRWLWNHDLFRPMALALGALNGLASMTMSINVLFAQEVLELDAAGLGLLGVGGAIGGVVGAYSAQRVSARLGRGESLFLAIGAMGALTLLTGVLPLVPLVFLSLAITSFLAVLWNVITVSLRQSLIPDHLLGRVNSVYRFFGWGAMPLGGLLGGLAVGAFALAFERRFALRLTHVLSAIGHLALLVWTLPRLNSARIADAEERHSA